MAYSEKIIDKAKDLFLTINDKGERAYSYQDIINKLSESFRKKEMGKMTCQVIGLWSRKYGWVEDLQAIKSLGQQKAIEITRDKELTINNAVSDDIADRRISALRIKKKADMILEAALDNEIERAEDARLKKVKYKPEIDLKTLQQIAHQREDIIQNLDGVKPKGGVVIENEDQVNEKINEFLNLRNND